MKKAKPKLIRQVSDLAPDRLNANAHTERGSQLMENSIRECGFGDSLTVDKDGVVISGNQRLETLADIQMENPIVVQSDGTRPIIHQRTDLSIKDKRARMLSIYQNRVAELNLEWDASILKSLADDVDVGKFWTEKELALLIPDSEVNEGPVPQLDKGAELQKKWKTAASQFWTVGRHRLWIGDCLKFRAGKSNAQLVVTDPPHEMEPGKVIQAIEGQAQIGIILAGDKLAFGLAKLWSFRLDLIWHHKRRPGIYNPNMPETYHAHCLILTQNAANKTGWRRPSLDFGSVIELPEGTEDWHVSLSRYWKPVRLFVEMLRGFKVDRIYDPFAGTLPSLLAADATGKTCYAVEADPAMAAIGLQRCADAGLQIKLDKRG